MQLQESGQMYLETIYILSKRSDSVRAIDVGEHMGYSKPSVSRAIGLLKRGRYITVDADGHIRLTDKGQASAEQLYDRHITLTTILMALGIDEVTATTDACRIEHVISDVSFNAIKNHLKEKGKK